MSPWQDWGIEAPRLQYERDAVTGALFDAFLIFVSIFLNLSWGEKLANVLSSDFRRLRISRADLAMREHQGFWTADSVLWKFSSSSLHVPIKISDINIPPLQCDHSALLAHPLCLPE